jgi:hypothetical protein
MNRIGRAQTGFLQRVGKVVGLECAGAAVDEQRALKVLPPSLGITFIFTPPALLSAPVPE